MIKKPWLQFRHPVFVFFLHSSFDFMDAPPVQTLITALEMLYALGALDEEGQCAVGRRLVSVARESVRA